MQIIAAEKNLVRSLTDFEIAVENLDVIETMPHAATQLLELTEDPNFRMSDLVDLLSSEPAIVVRVLRVASSPLYGSRPASSLRSALIRIGSRDLRKVVMTCGLVSLQLSPFCRELWATSLKVASISEVIAQYVRTKDLDDAFLCGLLHDYGAVLMNQVFGDPYRTLLQRPDLENQCQLEFANFGFDHCDLGAMLAQKWCLFEPLEHVMQHHHEPLIVDDFELGCASQRAVFLVALARQYVLGASESTPLLIDQLCDRLELSAEDFEICGTNGMRRFDESYSCLMQ